MSADSHVDVSEAPVLSPGLSANHSMQTSGDGDTDPSPSPSPTPLGRSPKRRRIHSPSDDDDHLDEPHPLNSPQPSPSSLPSWFNAHRTFLGHPREEISAFLSHRGVQQPTTQLLPEPPTGGRRSVFQYSPVASQDNMRFIGWRQKIDTWPTDTHRHLRRASTLPVLAREFTRI